MSYSVCIPIYKQDVRELAKELSRQASSIQSIVEILIIDDGSQENWGELNKDIQNFEKLNFQSLNSNIGRSAIRNLLAQKSKGEYLIFLDGDSKIDNPEFLKNYCEIEKPEVIVGGRSYAHILESGFELHWKYGKLKESKSASHRNTKPYSNFHSNNFLISKKIFQNILFEESLNQYGHEDTLFGFRLEQNKVGIIHIDNPLIHAQLESNKEFLRKTELGLQNLLKIQNLEPKFKEKSGVLSLYLKIKGMGLSALFNKLYSSQKENLLKNLEGNSPSLKKFNLYKLLYLFSISRR